MSVLWVTPSRSRRSYWNAKPRLSPNLSRQLCVTSIPYYAVALSEIPIIGAQLVRSKAVVGVQVAHAHIASTQGGGHTSTHIVLSVRRPSFGVFSREPCHRTCWPITAHLPQVNCRPGDENVWTIPSRGLRYYRWTHSALSGTDDIGRSITCYTRNSIGKDETWTQATSTHQ